MVKKIMKKILAFISIAALTITVAFAETVDTRNIKINGAVTASPYTFSLSYGTTALKTGDEIAGTFDLAKVSTTDNFIVERTSGNLNDDLSLTVGITASSFKGNFNGKEDYDTTITPVLSFVTGYDNTTPTVITGGHSGNTIIKIPAGYHALGADLAAFYFTINGKETVPAGTFISTVVVTYTYEQ